MDETHGNFQYPDFLASPTLTFKLTNQTWMILKLIIQPAHHTPQPMSL